MRKKIFKERRRLSLLLEKKDLENLIKISSKMSLQEKRVVSINELIRMAIQQCYPLGECQYKIKFE